MFLSRGDRDLGVAFQTHPGRQAFISRNVIRQKTKQNNPVIYMRIILFQGYSVIQIYSKLFSVQKKPAERHSEK